jgi:hypothetical protein
MPPLNGAWIFFGGNLQIFRSYGAADFERLRRAIFNSNGVAAFSPALFPRTRELRWVTILKFRTTLEGVVAVGEPMAQR